MAKRNHEPYDEHPLRPDGTVPPPAGPPGRDPHIGKRAARYISERIVGKIDDDESGDVFIKLKSGKKQSIKRVIERLYSHVGFNIELTIYEDSDPDVGMRIAEGLEGAETDEYGSVTWQGPSVYVWRLNHELRKAFPTREYRAALNGERLVVNQVAEGKPQNRYALTSPEFGMWLLEVRSGRTWEGVGDPMSFLEAVEEIVAMERRANQ